MKIYFFLSSLGVGMKFGHIKSDNFVYVLVHLQPPAELEDQTEEILGKEAEGGGQAARPGDQVNFHQQ